MKRLCNTLQEHIVAALKDVYQTGPGANEEERESDHGIRLASALTTWLSLERVSPEMRVALIGVLIQMFEGISRSVKQTAGLPASGAGAYRKPGGGVAIVNTHGPEQREGMDLLFQFLNWLNAPERTSAAKEALIRNLIVIAGEFERAFQPVLQANPPTASTRSH